MDFLHLIKVSSMVRLVLGGMAEETDDGGEILKSIEKLNKDVEGFSKIYDN